MPRIPLGSYDGKLRGGSFIDVRNLRGGTITAQTIILAGGTNGAIRSQNYDGTLGWAIFGDGSAYFGGTVVFGADLFSSNWESGGGTVPANLATRDSGATLGYYLDHSVGAAQFVKLYADSGELKTLNITGVLTMTSGGKIRTSDTGARIEISDAGDDSQVDFFFGSGAEIIPPSVQGTGTDTPDDVVELFLTSGRTQNGSDKDCTIRLTSSGGSAGRTMALKAESFQFTGDTFIGNMQTGRTSFIVAPWSGSTILIGDQGSIGSQGSFRIAMAWNMERNSSSTWTSMNVGSSSAAGVFEIGSDGYWFRFENSWGAAALPASVGHIGTSGDWDFGSGATGKARIHNAVASNTFATYSFVSDPDTGMNRRAANSLELIAGGADICWAHSDGFYVRLLPTTGSSANTYLNASGRIAKVTSARKYKSRINYNMDKLADIELRPVKFYRKEDKRWFIGFIADDLGEQEKLLGEYEDGEIENYDQRAVMAVMAAKINRLEELVTQLIKR